MRFRQHAPILGNSGFQGRQALLHRLQIVPLPYAANPTRRDEHTLLLQLVGHPKLPPGRLLKSDFHNGGFDLRLDYARDTLARLFRLWHRPVNLLTLVGEKEKILTFDGESWSETETGSGASDSETAAA